MFQKDGDRLKKKRLYKRSLSKFETPYLKSFIGYDYVMAWKEAITRYTVISSLNEQFDLESLTQMKTELKHTYLLSDSVKKSDYIRRRFHVISPPQLRKLIKEHSMSVIQ